jgi:hypothetical protein
VFADNIEYILDRAEIYELEILTEKFNKSNKEAWERTRFLGYIMMQTHSYKKKIRLTDVIEFPWDKPRTNNTLQSREEINQRINVFKQRIEMGNTREKQSITSELYFK